MFGFSAKITCGSSNSPLRSSSASKYGACNGLVSFALGVAFFVVVRLVVVLAAGIRRGPRKIADFLGSSDLPRVGLACGPLDLHRLGRLPHEHQRSLRTGHAALDEEKGSLRVDADDLVTAGRGSHIAHLA